MHIVWVQQFESLHCCHAGILLLTSMGYVQNAAMW